jgi:peroxiredoxin
MRINLLFLSLIMFVACSSKKDKDVSAFGTKIFVTLDSTEKVTLFLEELGNTELKLIDSAQAGSNNKFAFGINITLPGFYRVKTNDQNYFNLIVSNGETIEVNAQTKDLAYTYTVSGSEESDRLKSLNIYYSGLYKSSDSLNQAIALHQNNRDANAYVDALNYQQSLGMQHYEFIKKFVSEKPGSFASLAAVRKLDPDRDFSYFVMVEEALKGSLSQSPYYQDIKKLVDEYKKLAVGQPAPEITLNNPDGKPVSLSSFKGKVVMIDFWASWCKPCRAENPNVVKLYNKYHNKGFEILGVSLDQTKDAWVGAIKQDGLTWQHISDLAAWSSAVVPLYNIKGIPQTYLIDKDGNIMAKGLRGEELAKKLEELFGN